MVGDAKVAENVRDATEMPQPHRGPSRTAEFVALLRALESLLSADQRLFDDPYAHAFLGARLRAVLVPGPGAGDRTCAAPTVFIWEGVTSSLDHATPEAQ